MPEHQTPLIATIAAGLMLAFVLGLIAQRLRVQPLVGYLLAGVLVGPYTPGFTADPALATELAEIGVILLMFGVGLHFSLKDLLSVGRIAIPGAVGQIAVATLMGATLSWAMGWRPIAGLVFGLALSVASTVVLIRALQERHILETHRGRIAVGWLVVEDLAMVLALVLLPALAVATDGNGVPSSHILFTLLVTLAKVSIFVAIMLIVGRRVIPWLMHFTAHTGSLELAYDLLVGGDGRTILFHPGANYTDCSDANMASMLRHEHTVMALGDGGAHYGLICDASYTTHALTYWTRDRKGERWPLPWAIRQLTDVPARTVGLGDRGRIQAGFKADLNVIDLDRLKVSAPRPVNNLPGGGRRLEQKAEGYVATIVGGEVTYRDGDFTGARPGRLVRGAR